MKIAELLESYDQLTKKSSKKAAFTSSYWLEKAAFVPNPQVPQQGQPQPQQGQPQPQQGQPQPQQGQPQQGQPQPQQGQPQPQQDPAADPLMAQVMQIVQQLPPQVQQQVAPILQQIQSLPPDQRQQQLMQILQQLGAGNQQGQPQQGQPQPQQGQPQPQQGMVAQASYEEDMLAAGQNPAQPSPEEMVQQAQQMEQSQPGAADAQQAESSAIEAKNELDNVKVSLTVRELLDLIGKGSATASLLKVKQLADTHKQKMEQSKQKADTAQQQAQSQESQAQAGMMSGGIYPSPMGGESQ